MLTPNILKRMRAAAPLLPPPGDTELIKCLDEIDLLVEELDRSDKAVGDEIDHSEHLEECLAQAVYAVDPEWEWSNLKTPSDAAKLIVEHINTLRGKLHEAGQLSHQFRNERDVERQARENLIKTLESERADFRKREDADAARALELAAVRAELEELKARKVRLPRLWEIDNEAERYKIGRNAGITECAEAIRAAGLEVAS